MNIKEQIEIVTAAQNGSKIELRGMDKVYRELRNATTHEFNFQEYRYQIQKPKELSLEERVKKEYPDYEVLMIQEVQHKNAYSGKPYLSFEGFSHFGGIQPEHTCAQSMKGFYRYVYQYDGNICKNTNPIITQEDGANLFPIAVLFDKVKG